VVFAVLLTGLEHLVAGLFAESFQVFHGTGIRGDDLQHLPGVERVNALLGAQNRQRTVKPPGVNLKINLQHKHLD
jgi:hypothetical protein